MKLLKRLLAMKVCASSSDTCSGDFLSNYLSVCRGWNYKNTDLNGGVRDFVPLISVNIFSEYFQRIFFCLSTMVSHSSKILMTTWNICVVKNRDTRYSIVLLSTCHILQEIRCSHWLSLRLTFKCKEPLKVNPLLHESVIDFRDKIYVLRCF